MKSKKKVLLLRSIFFILLIATFILIFMFSNQNGEDSSATSQKFIYNILKFFISDTEKMEKTIIIIEPIIRKIAHFSIYTLAGIWLMSLLETHNLNFKNKITISLLIGFLYACSDEFHQSFVGERSASIKDVLIDTSGVLFGIILVQLFIRKIIHRKQK